MLVEFTVGNFLSFKENKTFSLVGATSVKEHEKDSPDEDIYENIFYSPTGTKLLKSSVIYGANNSGKSNLIKALGFFRSFILRSYNEQKPDESIKGILPFLLSTETENKPSFFEAIFFIGNTRYRYGFEADKLKIHTEWLFSLENSQKEKRLFVRIEDEGIKSSVTEWKNKEFQNATRTNSLFLSALAQFNGEVSKKIQNWFKSEIRIINGIDDDNLENIGQLTIHKFLNENRFRKQLIRFFKTIKIGFDEVEIIEDDRMSIIDNKDKFLESTLLNRFPKELVEELKEGLNAVRKVQDKMQSLEKNRAEQKNISIEFKHQKFNELGREVDNVVLGWALQSVGTQKLFQIFGIWVDTIEQGKILVIDELDSSLHTLITQELVKFFHTKANKSGQVIVALHDTNLLKKEIFRRDQIWFAEKNDKEGFTDLYSMVEYKDTFVRNDASFEKGYLEGKYGAIPYLGDIKRFINDFIYAPQ
jgi:AAA15 family ATPase/GTPase